jgi:hypothetical protein
MRKSISGISFPESEKEAIERAEIIAQRLREKIGGEWKACYWNNLGHCYNVTLGSISVFENIRNGEATFTTYISDKKGKTGGARSSWFPKERKFDNPEDSVAESMKTALENVKRLQEVLDNNKELFQSTHSCNCAIRCVEVKIGDNPRCRQNPDNKITPTENLAPLYRIGFFT